MACVSDDELLASAFRKILNVQRYSYLYIAEPDERIHVTLDDTYTDDDGLTREEVEAMCRVANPRNL